jgi:type III secretion apparatus needle protein
MATTTITPLKIGTAGTGSIGDQILTAFATETNTAAAAVNTSISASSANPGDPSTMIQMQVAMANYSIALQVQSSVVKSLEDTAKSITQKL